MELKTVEKRILVLTAAAVLTPVVSLILRMVLDENVGKYASIWFVVVGVPVVIALASLTRTALIEFDRSPRESSAPEKTPASEDAPKTPDDSKTLAAAEEKIRLLEAQHKALKTRAAALEGKIRDLEAAAEVSQVTQATKPLSIIDGLRSVIDHAGERVITTLTGGSQLEVGLTLSKEELEGVQSMMDSIGRKLARPQVEDIIEAERGDNTRRVLIIDDDMTSRRIIRALFPKDMKVNFTEADDGQIALQMMEKPPYPDVIICDVLMPNMDGLEFLARIRDLPRFSNTPVVMISANAVKDTVAKAGVLRANRFLRKPINRQELIEAVEAAIRTVGSTDSEMLQARQRLCLDDKAYFELSSGFSRAIGESITFVRSSISRDRWQAATLRINSLAGSIQMLGDERLFTVLSRVEDQLKRADVSGVTVELETLEQENERFMRTLVHALNAGDSAAPTGGDKPAAEPKPIVAVSIPD
jgi:CheY-like chemotaxis protein